MGDSMSLVLCGVCQQTVISGDAYILHDIIQHGGMERILIHHDTICNRGGRQHCFCLILDYERIYRAHMQRQQNGSAA